MLIKYLKLFSQYQKINIYKVHLNNQIDKN